MTYIRIPVICPTCGAASLQHFEIANLASALLSHQRIGLRSICHRRQWTASALEVEQIREYLQETVTYGHDYSRPGEV